MREILFRGKRNDGGGWVCGHYVYRPDIHGAHFIVAVNSIGTLLWFEVAPETVGQFTGLTDKNGKKIFEGDIFNLEDEIMAVVIFKDGCFRLEEYGLRGAWTESGFDEFGGSWGVIDCESIDWYSLHDAEVIGNIHDNPELLEVSHDET